MHFLSCPRAWQEHPGIVSILFCIWLKSLHASWLNPNYTILVCTQLVIYTCDVTWPCTWLWGSSGSELQCASVQSSQKLKPFTLNLTNGGLCFSVISSYTLCSILTYICCWLKDYCTMSYLPVDENGSVLWYGCPYLIASHTHKSRGCQPSCNTKVSWKLN